MSQTAKYKHMQCAVIYKLQDHDHACARMCVCIFCVIVRIILPQEDKNLRYEVFVHRVYGVCACLLVCFTVHWHFPLRLVQYCLLLIHALFPARSRLNIWD